MGPSVALPAVQAGKLNMLGFGSDKRVPQFPDVPTIAETVPGYRRGVSFGLFAPTGTPREIITKINADVQQIINDPEFHKRFLEPLVVQPLPGSLEAFADYLHKDSAKWAKVIKAAESEDRLRPRLMRVRLIASLAAFGLLAALPRAAQAQTYPSRPDHHRGAGRARRRQRHDGAADRRSAS